MRQTTVFRHPNWKNELIIKIEIRLHMKINPIGTYNWRWIDDCSGSYENARHINVSGLGCEEQCRRSRLRKKVKTLKSVDVAFIKLHLRPASHLDRPLVPAVQWHTAHVRRQQQELMVLYYPMERKFFIFSSSIFIESPSLGYDGIDMKNMCIILNTLQNENNEEHAQSKPDAIKSNTKT